MVSVLARANKKELITQSLQLAIAQLDNGNPFFQQAYLSCLRGGEYNGALGRLHGIIKSHRMQLDTAWAEAGAVGGGGGQVASPALAALAAESDMAAAALTVLQVLEVLLPITILVCLLMFPLVPNSFFVRATTQFSRISCSTKATKLESLAMRGQATVP